MKRTKSFKKVTVWGPSRELSKMHGHGWSKRQIEVEKEAAFSTDAE